MNSNVIIYSMPELPEVQTVVSDLQELVASQTLEKIVINDPKVWFHSSLQPKYFTGRQLRHVDRRGKYIVYNFGDIHLVQHLRMTGKMLLSDAKEIPHNIIKANSLQLRLKLIFNNVELVFYDPRRFGTMTAVIDLDAYFKSKQLAPELYSNEPQLALDHYLAKVDYSNRPIKSTILDQSIICGAGNIYADEALHRAGVHPSTPTNTLLSSQHQAIFAHLKEVMREAILKRGTSAADYLDLNGNPGVFKQYLKVYKRKDELCKTCDRTRICRIKIAGRSSHYCPKCQPFTKTND
ncbi:hypothetical protein COV81_03615 [Candidatus Peregrinibacteria bacterium CG11_big_fil_rev_8_21_14_0_20_41_10]|nr:MAG: hypothetical protein COV81_03615 [Candidatus Peregrinibacteria bacterium CG11_big_fil_rev_8_21_14_0_20_41_10]PIZ75061.1 MAG: hypothetical protein COY06_03250 [Candidatus Peregrinibacteria bacterium CG_4_10_14_0_2_um_filter_41_8]PJC38091.1 MAG: hypothetical protein CO045_02090 [Candidatus Peregrinibacteria bacterium CG_4_9_14_0_2_um_filter_41_14]